MHSVDSIAIIKTSKENYNNLLEKMKIMPTKLEGFYFVDFAKKSNKKILALNGVEYALEIFTDYFGGCGDQGSKLYHLTVDYKDRSKRKTFKSINEGLKFQFNIEKDIEKNIDQFDLIGIGSYRTYDDFFKNPQVPEIIEDGVFKVKIFNIKYDTSSDDGDGDIYLPDTITHTFTCEKEELEDNISDFISDHSGFCHFGFNYEII